MEIKDLVLNVEQLKGMGIHSEQIYIIEYDLHSKKKIPKNISDQEKRRIEARNRVIQSFRNKLFFILKFRVMATRHLESSWIIGKERLEMAVEELNQLKEEMAEKGLGVDKRLKIYPILVSTETYEYYEEQKAQFFLKFAMEHIQYIDKAVSEQRMANSTLWRCQRAYTIIEQLKEELKGHPDLYNEVTDTVALLGDKIAEVEEYIAKWKEEEKEE